MINMRFCNLLFVCLLILCLGCSKETSTIVTNKEELYEALDSLKSGDEIVMKNGVWEDVNIRLIGKGTESQPITLRAESAGEVIIQGDSDLKIGGDYLIVDGVYFKNGKTPSRSVVEFRISEDTVANYSIVRNSVIENYNQLSKNQADLWVQFWGKHNELSNCYLAGKSNRGPTIRVDISGNRNINNYHKIINNHFGPRPPKGGPSAETIQLGNSSTSVSPSHTLVANNLFEKCNGEVEVISSKSNYNEFRNNVFYKSEGSLVTRHGNYCLVDGNYFIGDEDTEHIGGVRLIGTGHRVTNNYFYNLRGTEFRSPLAIMNGIPRSPLNRYIQVTDVVVAHNTWVNCISPWHIGVGSNEDQRDVLPASEIRSAAPIRTTLANNFIYNIESDVSPIKAFTNMDGVSCYRNYINNQGSDFESYDCLIATTIKMEELSPFIMTPELRISNKDIHRGYDIQGIDNDIFGNSRIDYNVPGAISTRNPADPDILNFSKYGPNWHVANQPERVGQKINVYPKVEDLIEKLENAGINDTLVLSDINYVIDQSLSIQSKLTIMSKDENSVAKIKYIGDQDTPLFEMNPGGHLALRNIELEGTGSQLAFATLAENMSNLYNLDISGAEISNFNYVLKAYKNSMADRIEFRNCSISNCINGIELSEERDDRGEYNAEYVTVKNCEFKNVAKNVIDYYRGGYDESTIGGTLIISNSTFVNCGAKEENKVLLNTYGIINVDIFDNQFENNPVRYVAVLWGAKNNNQSGNTLSNSGSILVEENLKLNLMY